MRWTESTAEAMVKLGAHDRSGDWQGFWDFHIRHDQQRLYPAERWKTAVEK